MAITRKMIARQKATRIISQSLSRQLEIQPVDHLHQTVEEKLTWPGGSRRLTVKILTNKIMRKAHAVLFVVIVLTALIQEIRP